MVNVGDFHPPPNILKQIFKGSNVFELAGFKGQAAGHIADSRKSIRCLGQIERIH